MAAQVLVIESFRWHVTASGTRIQLTEKQSPFTVALFIMGPQLGAALCVSTPFHSYLQCHFNAIPMPFQCHFNAVSMPLPFLMSELIRQSAAHQLREAKRRCLES